MVEIHDPIRLMLIVEHFPEVLMEVFLANPSTYEWVKNYWVHFVVIQPETKQFLQYKDGEFVNYKPLSNIEHIDHLQDKLKDEAGNMPIYLIDSI
jgi:hypothetical protein